MNSVSANFGLGKVYYQHADENSDEKDKALVHFEKVIKINPKHYKSFTYIGIIYLER